MIQGRQAAWLVLGVAVLAPARDVASARVSGRLTTADGRELISAAVTMAAQDDDAAVRPESATISPDGRFSFTEVPAGRYQIRARGQTQPDGRTLFGTFTLAVGTRDISNVDVMLREGTTLAGRVTLHRARGRRPPPLSSLIVRAPLTDGSGFGDALTGRVKSDGSFTIRGLMAGTHHVLVEGVPESWMVESVHVRASDVTDLPFDVDERQGFDDVRVVMTDALTGVTLQVAAGKEPAADVPVAVFSASPEFWIRGGRRVRLARTDASGRATIARLPAGAYLAAAGRSIDERSVPRARALEQLRAGATAFSVAAGAADTVVTLRLDEDTAGRR